MNRFSVFRRAGIYVAEEVMSAQDCLTTQAAMLSSPSVAAELYENDDESRVDERTRRTRSVEPPAAVTRTIDALFDRLRPAIALHFKLELTRHEPPHFLLYRPGDFFVAHRDRSRSAEADVSSRLVSCVLFLNDDFTGGELNLFGILEGGSWDSVGFPCPPAAGAAVAFPAGMLHEVRPVTSGVRASVVTWFR